MVLAAVVEEAAGSGLNLLQPDFLDLLWGGIGVLLLLGIAALAVIETDRRDDTEPVVVTAPHSPRGKALRAAADAVATALNQGKPER